jgi:hypothetical protein
VHTHTAHLKPKVILGAAICLLAREIYVKNNVFLLRILIRPYSPLSAIALSALAEGSLHLSLSLFGSGFAWVSHICSKLTHGRRPLDLRLAFCT